MTAARPEDQDDAASRGLHPRLASDREALPALLRAVSDFAAGRVSSLDELRVAAKAAPLPFPVSPFDQCLGAANSFRRFMDEIACNLPASTGPRFLGFVTGGTTPAALIGDWLASLFDLNPVSPFDNSCALQVERETVDGLRQLFELPDAWTGALVSGATMSNFVGLAQAREWLGRQHGVRVSEQGLFTLPPPPVYSATPHASTIKTLAMLGIGRQNWRQVECLGGREALDVAALEALLSSNSQPAIVIASAGTVNTGDFDDFTALVPLKQRYGFWLHIDAAFGGFASLSRDHRPQIEDWECADSIGVDLHKWLNVPYDSAVAFTRHRDLQLDVFSSFSAYLGTPSAEPAPIHLTPENSHRWRALPAWFTLTAYGRDGHREIVERNCRLARVLGERIKASVEFQLLAPVRLNIVCFTHRDSRKVDRIAELVRDGGEAFVTTTRWEQVPALRAAFCNWLTTDQDLERVWSALRRAADEA